MTELYESLNIPGLKTDLVSYRACISNELADVPIETLCLPKIINTILKREKILRINDLLGFDASKIKGISNARADIIAKRLRTFFSYDI
jgi:hypothetical protein